MIISTEHCLKVGDHEVGMIGRGRGLRANRVRFRVTQEVDKAEFIAQLEDMNTSPQDRAIAEQATGLYYYRVKAD